MRFGVFLEKGSLLMNLICKKFVRWGGGRKPPPRFGGLGGSKVQKEIGLEKKKSSEDLKKGGTIYTQT